MLQLVSLKLVDFGPYKGEQMIHFPQERGIGIVYGENMRGKTSLLNAIRYAFFGTVIGRARRPGKLHDVGNLEQVAVGKFGFEVELELLHDGRRYRLMRSFRPPAGVTPTDDSDYKSDFFLERDGHIMPRPQDKEELERILPKDVSRFFLFDGELLQEYEELLVADSDMGPKISEAIERILGLPVLTGARASLTAARERAQGRYALVAQGDQKTRQLGTELKSLQAERAVMARDLARQELELDGVRARKAELEEAMRKSARMATLLDRRDSLEKGVEEAIVALEKRRAAAGELMATAWCALLEEPITAALGELRARETTLHTALVRTNVLQQLAGDAGAECPTCLQEVSPTARQKVRDALDILGGDAGLEEERMLADTRRRIDIMEGLRSEANLAALQILWANVEEGERDLAVRKDELSDVKRKLEGFDDTDLRVVRTEYEWVLKQIIALEGGISATRVKLDERAVYHDNIQRKLDRLGMPDLEVEKRRRDLASDLEKLFDVGVRVFRDQLRRQVEADATRHFLELTSEDDYAGLRINDNYGLVIVHRDGGDIPVRSAGAEHVVALSLVAALQNNAPLKGPIIIDSPFGRLDGTHTRKVVEALPNMADQVLLLVFEDELPPLQARRQLGSRLRAEWQIERRSARHSIIAARQE